MEKTSIFDQGPLDFEYLGRKTSHEGYGSRWMKGRIENPIEGDCLEMNIFSSDVYLGIENIWKYDVHVNKFTQILS